MPSPYNDIALEFTNIASGLVDTFSKAADDLAWRTRIGPLRDGVNELVDGDLRGYDQVGQAASQLAHPWMKGTPAEMWREDPLAERAENLGTHEFEHREVENSSTIDPEQPKAPGPRSGHRFEISPEEAHGDAPRPTDGHGEYGVLGRENGQRMGREEALALRDTAIAHGTRRAGGFNNVYLLGNVAVRIPRAGTDTLDLTVWPAHRVLTALADVDRVPRLFYVETDSAGNMVFEVQSRIHGNPVDSLFHPQVAHALSEFEDDLARVPRSRLPDLPEDWPESGDSAGFLHYYNRYDDSQYQLYRVQPLYRAVFDALEFPESLTQGMTDEFRHAKSQPFQVLHGDITTPNVSQSGNDVHILDFDMATYGPRAHDEAVMVHRHPGTGTGGPTDPRLRPHLADLDNRRAFNDTVRLIDTLRADPTDLARAHHIASYASGALTKIRPIWGTPTSNPTSAPDIVDIAQSLLR